MEFRPTWAKITRAKGAGGMAQVVKCLPSKHEAFSSNPRITKKKKRNSGVEEYS
jgi:hypothetical protein